MYWWMMVINDDVLVIPVCSCEYFQIIKIYIEALPGVII